MRGDLPKYGLALLLAASALACRHAQGDPFVRITGDQFTLNGEVYKLKGTNYYPPGPPVGGHVEQLGLASHPGRVHHDQRARHELRPYPRTLQKRRLERCQSARRPAPDARRRGQRVRPQGRAQRGHAVRLGNELSRRGDQHGNKPPQPPGGHRRSAQEQSLRADVGRQKRARSPGQLRILRLQPGRVRRLGLQPRPNAIRSSAGSIGCATRSVLATRTTPYRPACVGGRTCPTCSISWTWRSSTPTGRTSPARKSRRRKVAWAQAASRSWSRNGAGRRTRTPASATGRPSSTTTRTCRSASTSITSVRSGSPASPAACSG